MTELQRVTEENKRLREALDDIVFAVQYAVEPISYTASKCRKIAAAALGISPNTPLERQPTLFT